MKTLLLACLMATSAFPQLDQAQTQLHRFYKLDFAVKELDAGKAVSSRNYTMMASPGERSEVRIGEKIPVPSGGNSPGGQFNTNSPGQFTYVDAGVFIQCTILNTDENRIVITVAADISGVGAQTSVGPVIRTVRWNSRAVLPLKKAATLFTSDATGDKKQIQLELTATPIL